MNRLVTRTVLVASSALGLIHATAATAQTAPAPAKPVAAATVQDAGVDTVVVSARRIDERLQDVPISITVFNQQQLSDHNVTFASDLATYTPSLSVDNQMGNDATAFSLRGFSQALQTTPTVGVMFADVVEPRGGAIARSGEGAGPGDLFDLQNVQVLKGPQGTLFGRNTTGGDVLLVPKKPTGNTEGYLEVSAGNYDMERVQGVFNTPINDNVRIRLGFDQQTRDGWLHNVSSTGPSDFNDVNYFALRGSIVIDVTPNIENYTIATWTQADTHGTQAQVFACSPNGFLGLGGSVPALGSVCTTQLAQQKASGDPYAVENNLPDAHDFLQSWRFINTTTWHATDELTVKNIMSYSQLESSLRLGLFGDRLVSSPATGSQIFPFAIVDSPPGTDAADQETFTEELQFQGRAFDGKFQWQAGGYLELSDPLGPSVGVAQSFIACSNVYAHQCTDVVAAMAEQAFGLPAGAIEVGSTEDKSATIMYRNVAGYAQGTYALTSQLKLTAGVRYTSDYAKSNSTDVLYAYPEANTPVASCKVAGQSLSNNCAASVSEASAKPTWMLDLEWTPVRDILGYVKYSRGYRQGDVNGTGTPPEYSTFKPETVDVYEIGAKTSWRGQIPGSFNIAGFYNDFTNQQILDAFAPTGLGSYTSGIVNAGKSRIWGIEFEATARPLPGLSFDLNYTYLNSKLESQSPLNAPGYTVVYTATTGGPLTFTPENKASFATTYRLPLDRAIGQVNVGMTYIYTDATFITVGSPYGTLPAYGILDFSVDWNAVYGRPVDLAFFINNATDKFYEMGVPGVYASAGFETRNLGEPRMYGVRLRYHFGS